MEDFRLVAELITWLVKVFLSKAIKAQLKLYTKTCYQADGYAVKKIGNIITSLYKVLRNSKNKELDDEVDIDHQYRSAMNDDIGTLTSVRLLYSTITQKGTNLHKLLEKELDAFLVNILSGGMKNI